MTPAAHRIVLSLGVIFRHLYGKQRQRAFRKGTELNPVSWNRLSGIKPLA